MYQQTLRLFIGALLLLSSPFVLATNHAVRVGSALTFTPSNLTIQRGDTVTFTNAGGFHNVVADNGSFRCAASCDQNGGNGAPSSAAWSATVTYDTAGTFGYFCEVHGGAGGSGMSGRITVEGVAPPPPPPPFTIGAAVSGNWYDPAQNGHGIQFELVTPTILTAFWFTFDSAGNQVWVVGAGTIDGDHVVMQANRSGGGRFPPNFNPASIVNLPWGTMTFTFSDCDTGRLDWASTDPAFTASGTMPLKRLTQIQGVSCVQP